MAVKYGKVWLYQLQYRSGYYSIVRCPSDFLVWRTEEGFHEERRGDYIVNVKIRDVCFIQSLLKYERTGISTKVKEEG
jgi:hypothetical protein